jgi:hypothetical protein
MGKITIEGRYKTRDGRNVRILATDLKDLECPVIALVEVEAEH